MQVQLRILRYDPERDPKPHWEQYTVEAEPTAPLLDLLHTVKWHQDGSLTFRRSCAHGVCGSDAMLINGRNRLACKIRVDQLGSQDHASRRCPGWRSSRTSSWIWTTSSPSTGASCPYQVDDGPMPARERLQSPGRTGRATTTRPSASCAPRAPAPAPRSGPRTAMWVRRRSSTPTGSSSTPATQGADERLEILADEDGVWRCRTIFNCTDACPRGINITRAILEVSSAIVERGV